MFVLHKSNPWAGGNCSRESCLMCRHGDGKQDCRMKNIVYQISCLECANARADSNENDPNRCRLAIYTGQTARTGYERGREHFDGLKKKHENNPLFKHAAEAHNKAEIEFKMKVVKRHFSAFSRLVHESVLIESTSKNSSISVLNSRLDFARGVLPRLVIEDDEERAEKESFLARVGIDKDNREGKAGIDKLKDDGSEGGGGQVEFQSDLNINSLPVNSCKAVGRSKECGGAKFQMSSKQINQKISRHKLKHDDT